MANDTIPTCYTNHFDIIKAHDGSGPCGGSTTENNFCCVKEHVCMEDGLCRFINTVPGMITSGYYVGSCTDNTFKDPACRQACSRFRTADVVYSDALGLWQCCQSPGSNGTIDCAHPGSESFEAPPPESLSTAPSYTPPSSPYTSPTATELLSTPSTSNLVPPTSTTSPLAAISTATSSSSSSEEISSGAKAGIGVGVAAASFAVVVALAFFFIKRRRTKRRQEGVFINIKEKQEMDATSHPFTTHGDTVEISGTGVPPELDGQSRSELGGPQVWPKQ
ncbi:MAG: hypothetical protein LQ346_003751 [Caloplaca aetnensis]|nr:MAG: hypothetical protein LQ346_003751 [Caloplaca aetnensis]